MVLHGALAVLFMIKFRIDFVSDWPITSQYECGTEKVEQINMKLYKKENMYTIECIFKSMWSFSYRGRGIHCFLSPSIFIIEFDWQAVPFSFTYNAPDSSNALSQELYVKGVSKAARYELDEQR